MANNIYTYIETTNKDNPLQLTSDQLTSLGADKTQVMVYPPGLGGFDSPNTKSAELPFILFAPYKRPKGVRNTRDTVIDSLPPPDFVIALPLVSSALTANYKVSYEPVGMGAELELIVNRIQNFDLNKVFADSVSSALTGTVASLPVMIPQLLKGNYTGAAATAVVNSLKTMAEGPGAAQMGMYSSLKELANKGLKNASDAIEMGLGVAENPFTEQVFKTVEPRRFTYNFIFMPRNEDEAILIDKIIQVFKYYMLPAYTNIEQIMGLSYIVNDQITTAGAFFSYPNEFQITYSVQDTTFSLLPSVLSDMSVTYDEGMDSPKFFVATTKDKKQYPVKTSLKLEFTEVMIITRDKVLAKDIIKDSANLNPNRTRIRF